LLLLNLYNLFKLININEKRKKEEEI